MTAVQAFELLSSLPKLGANGFDLRFDMSRKGGQVHDRHHVCELANSEGRRIESEVDAICVNKFARQLEVFLASERLHIVRTCQTIEPMLTVDKGVYLHSRFKKSPKGAVGDNIVEEKILDFFNVRFYLS